MTFSDFREDTEENRKLQEEFKNNADRVKSNERPETVETKPNTTLNRQRNSGFDALTALSRLNSRRYNEKVRGGVLRYPLEAMTEHTDYLQIDI